MTSQQAIAVFHFSQTGTLLGTALPRRLFGPDPPFELSPQLGEAVITSAGNRVLIYSPQTRELFELRLDGAVLASYTIPLPETTQEGKGSGRSMALMGVVLTPNMGIYARLVGGDGAGIYELDRSHQRWVPLSATTVGSFRNYSLIGSNGNALVLCPAGNRGTAFNETTVSVTPRFAP